MDGNAELVYARALLLQLVGRGPGARVPWGIRKQRPVEVTDDLGRTVTFEYFPAVVNGSAASRIHGFDFGEGAPEMLARVRGPGGTVVEFNYSRPGGYSPRLNEWFLTDVDRTTSPAGIQDVLAAPARSMRFDYMWPGVVSPNYLDHEAVLYADYLWYYQTFIGCHQNRATAICTEYEVLEHAAAGNPCYLAEIAREDYISIVADNIVTVHLDEVIESETRYSGDPEHTEHFDRVIRQRWGGQEGLTRERGPEAAGAYSWQTNLPMAVLEYRPGSSQPDGLAGRYPMEAVPTTADDWDETVVAFEPDYTPEDADVACGEGFTFNEERDCRFDLSGDHAEALPGYRHLLQYFEAPHDPQVQLRSTALTCGQIALAQVSHAIHNDVLSRIVETPDPQNPGGVLIHYERVTGKRARIAKDANRICGWTKLSDQNGDESWLGLNYRGQTLVRATLDPWTQQYTFEETLYNADGNVLEVRLPQTGGQARGDVGYTRYTYDERDLNGGEWDGWLPSYWSRRGNLLRADVVAPDGGVIDEVRKAGQSVIDPADPEFATREARFSEYTYEPLFNQVLQVRQGVTELGVDLVEATTDYFFDYQELSEAELESELYLLEAWGFSWVRDPAGGLNWDAIRSWQLPMELGLGDLNGDGRGAQGGVPVVRRTVHEWPAGVETTLMGWNLGGRLVFIDEIGGARYSLEYHPVQDGMQPLYNLYGSVGGPVAASINNRGLLAGVTVDMYDDDHAGLFVAPVAPCQSLKGPYQWLLGPDCASDPTAELLALGLASEVVQAIVGVSGAESNSVRAWEGAQFSYNELGEVSRVFTDVAAFETGDLYFKRDVDGRVLEKRDERGHTTINEYDNRGNLVWHRVGDGQGGLSRNVKWAYDREGRVLLECVDRAAGGGSCGTLPLDPSPPDWSNNSVARTGYQYWADGTLKTVRDPVGVETHFAYDEFRREIQRTSFSPGAPGDFRRTQTGYDDLGRVATSTFGTGANGTDLLTESFFYDGFGRLKHWRNTRGKDWHFSHGPQDEIVRYKQDLVDYTAPVANPDHEVVISHDRLLRPSFVWVNGQLTSSFRRSVRGNWEEETRRGIGTFHRSFRTDGTLVFEEEPDGSQHVVTRSFAPHQRTESHIRKRGNETLTTGVIEQLDPSSLVVSSTRYGGPLRATTLIERDARGLLARRTGPEGLETTYLRDVAGYLTDIQEEVGVGVFANTHIVNNGRGQPITVTDPENQTTHYSYTPFGERKTMLDAQARTSSWAWDSLGRLRSWTNADGQTVLQAHDPLGDRVSETWSNAPAGPRLLTEWSHDALGRVLTSTSYNPALQDHGIDERIVEREVSYDELGRVERDAITIESAGNGPPLPTLELTASWVVSQTSDLWERTLSYPANGSSWTQYFDATGRLDQMYRDAGPAGSIGAGFDWIGDIYRGRSQSHVGDVSPFRQLLELDALGEPVSWEYRALDLLGNGPVDAQEGAAYCAGAWQSPECAGALLSIEALRDTAGRVRSVDWRFGHPLRQVGGALLPDASHLQPWRGYNYDSASRLAREWVYDGSAGKVPTVVLTPPGIQDYQINDLGQAWGEGFDYTRAPGVGSLNAVVPVAGGPATWSTLPRGTAYELDDVFVDGRWQTVSHTVGGRVSQIDNVSYGFDPLDRLVTANDGAGIEAYLYDDAGRLAAAIRGGQVVEMFGYDGPNMIVSATRGGNINWEAAWGPGIKNLIEWRDIGGGSGDHIPLQDHRNSIVATWEVDQNALSTLGEYTPAGRFARRDTRTQATECEEEGTGDICEQPGGMPFGFEGAWKSSSGIMLMGARWYSPKLGEFLTRDPLGAIDGYNQFAFAAHDPINLWDPSGMSTKGVGALRNWVRKHAVGNLGVSPGLGPRPPPPWITPPPRVPRGGGARPRRTPSNLREAIEQNRLEREALEREFEALGPPPQGPHRAVPEAPRVDPPPRDDPEGPAGRIDPRSGPDKNAPSPEEQQRIIDDILHDINRPILERIGDPPNPCESHPCIQAVPDGTPSPALRDSPYHPDKVEVRIRPEYRPNPAHDMSSPHYNPEKGPEPDDAREVYDSAVRTGLGTWYGRGQGGWYRYFSDNAGGAHFSGVVPEARVPAEARRTR